jgi:hypothetical protein
MCMSDVWVWVSVMCAPMATPVKVCLTVVVLNVINPNFSLLAFAYFVLSFWCLFDDDAESCRVCQQANKVSVILCLFCVKNYYDKRSIMMVILLLTNKQCFDFEVTFPTMIKSSAMMMMISSVPFCCSSSRITTDPNFEPALLHSL